MYQHIDSCKTTKKQGEMNRKSKKTFATMFQYIENSVYLREISCERQIAPNKFRSLNFINFSRHIVNFS